jgi:uncharacterized protein YggE
VPVAIDTSIRSGASSVESLQFLLRDERAVREATLRARADVQAMAAAAGLLRVRPHPPWGRSPACPPGNPEIRALVTITLAVR